MVGLGAAAALTGQKINTLQIYNESLKKSVLPSTDLAFIQGFAFNTLGLKGIQVNMRLQMIQWGI